MIIAVDHLTRNSADFDADGVSLLAQGFVNRFTDRGVPNPKNKQQFVQTFLPTHDISYFEAPSSLNVEVINQGACEAQRTPELVPIWDHSSLRGFVLRVSALKKAVALWKALGFTLLDSSTTEAQLRFVSPLIHDFSVELHLIADPGRTTATLDTLGWGLPAMASTNPSCERDSLTRAGFSVTPLETIAVGGKRLTLFFVFADGVPPVEIIGIAR